MTASPKRSSSSTAGSVAVEAAAARAAQQAEATTVVPVSSEQCQWRRGWRDGGGVMQVARVAEKTVIATRGNRGTSLLLRREWR